MTNPFTSFAFKATSEPTDRTLPDRLADIRNVCDFGAVGDWNGTTGTDNLAAIMAAFNKGQISLVTTASNIISSFTGSISGTNLTVSAVSSGTIGVGEGVVSSGFSTHITSQTSGTPGGVGVYVVDVNQTVASGSMKTVTPTMTFASVPATVVFAMYAIDVTTPTAFADTFPIVLATTATTVTLSYIVGVVNSGDTITFNISSKGTLYFPPGAYYVSAPIDISAFGTFINFLGCMGASTIVGNFGDYVIKRYLLGTNATSGGHVVEKLTIINQHATGGGIRMGVCVGAAIRDCDITANYGIDTDNSDVFGPPDGPGAYWGSLDITIDNCQFRAYNALASGSTGLARDSNGATLNCTFKDFDTAYRVFGGQGGQSVLGCYFEHNNYGMASSWGPLQPTPGTGGASFAGLMVEGCHFKNNGTAILIAGAGRYTGIRIEATEGTIAGNPQYGIYGGAGAHSLFAGITIVGQYQIAGLYLEGGEVLQSPGLFAGIVITNTSTLGGVTWRKPTTAQSVDLEGCNLASVWTMSQLPAKTYTIASASWSGGIATITVVGGTGDLPTGQNAKVYISGMTPSGYNGTFTADVPNFFTLTFAVANPGGAGTIMGTAFVIPVTGAGDNMYEGYDYNVTDCVTTTWGAEALGGGSTHGKVRYDGTNWTLVGK